MSPAKRSLSAALSCRIIPRHRFLQVVNAQPGGPFPMAYLKYTDERYVKLVAHTSLEQFQEFRSALIRRSGAR